MKSYLVLIFLSICGLFIKSIKTTATCKYEASYIRLEDQTIQIYGCKLKVNESESLLNIQGKHIKSKDDSEIEAINKVSNSFLTRFPSIFCDKFENLQVIVFSSAEIEKIDENSFKKCKNLKILDLFGNQISDIPDELFAGNSKLTKLCLSTNKLKNLPSDVFVNLKHLKNLDLSHNELNILDPNWFEDLQNLKILDLKFNKISELPEDVFEPLENLEVLNLASNSLERINSDSFGSNQNFKILNFKDNKINEIDKEFIENVAIEELNLENNLCFNKEIINKSKLYENLKICFENYKTTVIQVSHKNHSEFMEKCNQKVQKDTNRLKLKFEECYGEEYANPTDSITKITSCGTVRSQQRNIIGNNLNNGLSPWYANIETNTGQQLCDGTLISTKHVITAANCIFGKLNTHSYIPRNLLVFLGSPRTVTHTVEQISIHPDWNTNTEAYDADIAILTLTSEIFFTDLIQPICLIDPKSKFESLEQGFVLGIPSSGETTVNGPKQTEVKILQNEDCFLRNYELARLSSRRTFCGVSINSTGSCPGDTGAPMLISNEGISYFRGILAVMTLNTEQECDADTQAVYTDLLKYSEWIQSNIRSDQIAIDSGEESNILSITDIPVDKFIDKIIKKFMRDINEDLTEEDLKCTIDLAIIKNQMNEKLEKCVANQKAILNYGITSQNKCGKPKILRGTIIGGSRLIQGSFPWIAALMRFDDFLCGGTIISSKKVVTAAHCVLTDDIENRLRPEQAKVLLGMHNLKDPNEIGRVKAIVENIVPHYHWNPKTPSYDADIAVLELKNEVQFTVYIQPICLISPDAIQEDITKGYVVGYGKSEDRTKIHEDTPKIIETPIMGFNNCSDNFKDIQFLLSNRMFCGGYANGTGTCTGDSGSGLYVEHDETYYLRGIVSSSLYNYLNECNVNKPSAFTDAIDFYIFMTTGKAGSRKPV